MKSSLKISLASLVLILLFGGSLYLVSKSRTDPTPSSSTPTNSVSVEEIQVAPLVKMVDTPSPSVKSCDSLASAAEKESCIRSIESDQISEARSVSDCEGLTLSLESCKDTFRLRAAEINRNLDDCADISTSTAKVQCQEKITYLIATFDGRVELCKNIGEDASLRTLCEDKARGVAESTATIQKNEKIITQAISSGDENSCKNLGDTSQIIACLKPIILKEKNGSLCKTMFSEKTSQEQCFNFVSYEFDRMIIDEVVAAKSTALCDKIMKPNSKEQCQKLSF